MELPQIPDPSSPPVFDCHVIISGPDDQGKLTGVVSNLPHLTANASNERALLQALVGQFKAYLQECQQKQQPITWSDPQTPVAGEQQRWIPVHL